MSQEISKKVYYAYIHSVMNYEFISWGNSSHNTKFLKYKKNIIRILQEAEIQTHVENYFRM
jgi:serine acetyltransferase